MQKIVSRFLFLVLALLAFSCRTEPFAEGKSIYKAYCSNCHMDDGTGLGLLIPPLTDTQYLIEHKKALPCIIKNGQSGPITVNGKLYDQVMPGFELTDVQILNLINYITNSFGNEMGYSSITEVKEWSKNCP